MEKSDRNTAEITVPHHFDRRRDTMVHDVGPSFSVNNPCREMVITQKSELPKSLFTGYSPETFFDEMMGANGEILPHYRKFHSLFGKLSAEEFNSKRHSADLAFLRQGVTFNVYGD